MKSTTHSLLRDAARSSAGWQPPQAAEAAAELTASRMPMAAAAPAGADFSSVRVHTEGPLAAAAEDLGARAFAYGCDVAFAPGEYQPQRTSSQQLLAHELTHVAQQAEAGASALQFQPKEEQAGIGAAPPDESFLKDEGDWGAEDEHVLFEKNQAVPGSEDAVAAWAARQTEAVKVFVHGYASEEGPREYNLNLSAHRGAAVKHLLEKMLPAGSEVVIFAHGQSSHFGASDNNRRVGISLIGPARPPLRLPGGGLHYSLAPKAAGGPFLTRPVVTAPPAVSPLGVVTDPTPVGPRAPASPPLGAAPPLLTPRRLMDNAALLAPSATHGVSPGATGNVVDQWDTSYFKYHGLGIPDEYRILWGLVDIGAGELANKEVSNSIQAYHERNDPTVIERSNAEVGAHIINSPNLLNLFSKKKKDKKEGK